VSAARCETHAGCADCARVATSLILAEIPPHVQDGIRMYVVHRRATGGFLMACFANDLRRAACNADPQNLAALGRIARWIAWESPPECAGSQKAVDAWLAKVDA
jgi:hypothetical protein